MQLNNKNIIELFNFANELTKLFITQMELTPIHLTNDIYLSGFRLVSYDKVEAHLKKIKTIKLDNGENIDVNDSCYTTTPIEEMWTTLPIEEMWTTLDLIDFTTISTAFSEFKTNFFKLKGFDVVTLEYKEEGKPLEKYAVIYDNKRVACKTTLEFKKTHRNTIHKFLHFGEGAKKEKTELDIVTSAAEED